MDSTEEINGWPMVPFVVIGKNSRFRSFRKPEQQADTLPGNPATSGPGEEDAMISRDHKGWEVYYGFLPESSMIF